MKLNLVQVMKRNAFSRPAQYGTHTDTGAWHEAGAAALKCPTDTHDMLIKRPQTADGDGLTDS